MGIGGRLANAGNLVPNSERTPRQRREQARRGGIASGRARRERRDMRETFRALLDMPMRPGGTSSFGSMESAEGKNMTVGEAIAMTMLRAAIEGDVRAAEFVRDTSGQRPSQSVEVSSPSRDAADAFMAMLDEVRAEAPDGGD